MASKDAETGGSNGTRSTTAPIGRPRSLTKPSISNGQFAFAQQFGDGRSPFLGVSKSKAFGALGTFLIFLWGGTLLLSSVGTTQPVAAGIALGVLFIGLRVKHFKARAKRR